MPRDIVPLPVGRVRMHKVNEVFIKCGRSVGKSTSTAARGSIWQEMFKSGKMPGWHPSTDWIKNTVLFEWGAIIGNLLLKQGLNFGIGGMYMEFTNVASPGDTVSPPTLTRDADQGVSYYNQLITSPDTDYLRVPLIAGVMNISDILNFPKGNLPTFFAQTSGMVGVHGKPFGDAYNSTVFGGALVAFVNPTDATQDLVFSRYYLTGDLQQVKLPTSQIGVEWALTLE